MSDDAAAPQEKMIKLLALRAQNLNLRIGCRPLDVQLAQARGGQVHVVFAALARVMEGGGASKDTSASCALHSPFVQSWWHLGGIYSLGSDRDGEWVRCVVCFWQRNGEKSLGVGLPSLKATHTSSDLWGEEARKSIVKPVESILSQLLQEFMSVIFRVFSTKLQDGCWIGVCILFLSCFPTEF